MSDRAFPSFLPEIHFGIYTVDVRAGELRKNGIRIKLQDRPFQILVLLLERPGEVVTREELRSRLWPAGTFVDFDHGISSAVQKLRSALCDSAATPRFIETVGRRGYRFLYPVKQPDAAKVISIDRVAGRSASVAPPASPPLSNPTITPASGSTVSRRVPPMWLRLVLACLVLVPVAIIARQWWSSAGDTHVLRIVQMTHSGTVHPNQNLLTDGPRLYYVDIEQPAREAHPSLKSIAVDGGEPVTLPAPLPTFDLQDISPSGDEILIRNLEHIEESEVWSVPLPTGSAHRIGNIWGHDFTYAPDGRHFAFTNAQTIYTAAADGSDVHPIAHVPGDPYMLRWSPNSDVLRFTLIDSAQHIRLWEVNMSGQARPLLVEGEGPKSQAGGGWSADGRYFVFSSRDEGQRDVWLLREGSHGRSRRLTRLTHGPMTFWRPMFSRDGRRIFAVGIQARGELVAYDPASHQYQAYLGGISADFVSFSPDRQWVVYARYPDATLWRARADGTGDPLQLTFPPLHAMAPRWSPDGTQILFSGAEQAADWKIYLIGADGGGLQRLVADERPQQYADWSPDGTQIVFGEPPELSQAGPPQLYILDRVQHKIQPVPGGAGLWDPVWSPDGRCIAALRTVQPAAAVCLNPRTGQARVVATRGGSPSWSSNGRYLYLSENDGRSIFRVRIEDGTTESVRNDPAFRGTGRWGVWTAVLADGRVLLLRDRSNFDIYALDWVP